MKRIVLLLSFAITAVSLYANPAPEADTAAAKVKYWKPGIATSVGFSQMSLTNWAAGGFGQIPLNAYADIYANYDKDKIVWKNELQVGYGFIENFEDGYQKSDDRLTFDSKFGYKAVEKLYISSVFNFRSQFAKGYNNKTDKIVVSDFFAPAYMSLGLGIDYNPWKNLAINFAPLTGKTVMVKDYGDITKDLRERYGNAADQFCRFELGAQLKVDGKVEVKNFKVSTTLVLFSDYLNKPQNIKVTWDVNADVKLTELFSVTLRTNLIYDDNIKIVKKAGEEPTAGVQFREIFSIGFAYTIGNKK